MRRAAGFSMVELLVATAILLAVLAGTMEALTSALRANEEVSLQADMEENLRAGMNYMVRDLVQAAEGVPTGGIPIPSGGGGAAINRPGPAGLTFPATYATLPSVTPGPALGPLILKATDMITILYVDNTLMVKGNTQGPNPAPLQAYPINNAASPVCKGTLSLNGSKVVFDANCANLGTGNVTIAAGDLVMFTNPQGSVLQTVTAVGGQTLTFAAGDAFGLNGRADPQGTIGKLQAPPNSGVYPPTTATQVWMITYYLDNTDPLRPQLLRQINFNAAQAVGTGMEDMQISYDVVDGLTNPANVKQPVTPDTPAQIRKVNLYLAARSDARFSQSGDYIRNNLPTQVGPAPTAPILRPRPG
jgi:type II secretory pathway pseudopilin PulG